LLSCGCVRSLKPEDLPLQSILWEPVDVQKSNTWRYVGDGRGQYDAVDKFRYIGENEGSFEMSQRSSVGLRRCLSAFAGVLLLAIILLFGGYALLALVSGEPPSLMPVVGNIDRSAAAVATTMRVQGEAVLAAVQPLAASAGRAVAVAASSAVAVVQGIVVLPEPEEASTPTKKPRPQAVVDGPLYNCMIPIEITTWSQPKRKWCCVHKEVGCAPFECEAEKVTDWSEEKVTWCCRHERKGCAPTKSDAEQALRPEAGSAADAHKARPDAWVPEKRSAVDVLAAAEVPAEEEEPAKAAKARGTEARAEVAAAEAEEEPARDKAEWGLATKHFGIA